MKKCILVLSLVSISTIFSGASNQRIGAVAYTTTGTVRVNKVAVSPAVKKDVARRIGLKDSNDIEHLANAVLLATSCTDDKTSDTETKKMLTKQLPNCSRAQINEIHEHLMNARKTSNKNTFIEEMSLAVAKIFEEFRG